jgi:hypothetical protein
MQEITGVYLVMLALGLLCLSGIADAGQVDATEAALTDDFRPHDGTIGADSPLYGLKLALEDMDLSFTADETTRIGKEMDQAQLRLLEVRRSLDLNQSESAGKALSNYLLKTDLASFTITTSDPDGPRLLHAQEMLIRHQIALENLLAGYPDNMGLRRAHSNSLALEEKFTEKTGIQYQRTVDQNNQIILTAIRLRQNHSTDMEHAIAVQTDDTDRPEEGQGQ